MYRRIILVLVAISIFFTGCGALKPQKNFEEISKRLLRLSTYTCDVVMRVTNNKSTMEYKLRHYYKSPNKYKLEVLAPKELEGQVTIYNGSSAYIYHPQINEYLITENFSSSPEFNAFIGSFMEYIRKAEDIKLSNEKQGDKELIVLEYEVSAPKGYMQLQKLWLDPEAAVPVKAEIYDKEGKISVEVLYSSFVYNPDLKDGDFEIKEK